MSSLSWIKSQSIYEFKQSVFSFLLHQENRYATTISLIQTIENQKISAFHFWGLYDQTICCGFAILSLNGRLDTSELPNRSIPKLVDVLQKIEIKLHKVVAPTQTSKVLIQAYHGEFYLEMLQYIFRCNTVILPNAHAGQLIQASPEHAEIVHKLSIGFMHDCFPKMSYDDSMKQRILHKVTQGEIYLWQVADDIFVSMAAKVRDTPNTASISWVYTPNEYRGHGYGSRVTAYVSQQLLQEGRAYCNLLTDASNPTSNAMYQRIGYQKIGEQSIYILDVH